MPHARCGELTHVQDVRVKPRDGAWQPSRLSLQARRGPPWRGSGCENERAARFQPATGGGAHDRAYIGADSRRCGRYPRGSEPWYRCTSWRSRLAEGSRGADPGARTSVRLGSSPRRGVATLAPGPQALTQYMLKVTYTSSLGANRHLNLAHDACRRRYKNAVRVH